MVSEETIKQLVGYEFPSGEYTIEHWENFLLTECTGGDLMQDNVVHPVALFHVPIMGCNTTIAKMFELGHAESDASILVESYEWETFHPLKEDTSYKISGGVIGAERCRGEGGNIYDRVQFRFELVDPQGELAARSVIIWHYTRTEESGD